MIRCPKQRINWKVMNLSPTKFGYSFPTFHEPLNFFTEMTQWILFSALQKESYQLLKGQVLLLLISFKKATKGNWQGKSWSWRAAVQSITFCLYGAPPTHTNTSKWAETFKQGRQPWFKKLALSRTLRQTWEKKVDKEKMYLPHLCPNPCETLSQSPGKRSSRRDYGCAVP